MAVHRCMDQSKVAYYIQFARGSQSIYGYLACARHDKDADGRYSAGNSDEG